jgi:hypothetical protein
MLAIVASNGRKKKWDLWRDPREANVINVRWWDDVDLIDIMGAFKAAHYISSF